MKLLNGKEYADKIKEAVKLSVEEMAKDGESVCLAVIQVGDDEASSVYVKNKERACEYCGIESRIYNLPEYCNTNEILDLINQLNNDETVNGILVQLPLPKHINEYEVVQAIMPEKDVDGFHELNIGKLTLCKDVLAPCTATGIVDLLLDNEIEISGKNCVVVGRSNIVGKPTAMMLLQLDGTVTICHSKTQNLKDICKNADILVCAIGKPKFFNKEYIKEGAVVVDVGIHRTENGLCGDVDFDDVKDIVSAITPVPKGIGSVTVAELMVNCYEAARMQYESSF